jgi:hypothetical protein
LLGDISPKKNPDGSNNGLSTLVETIQNEIATDPVIIIGQYISGEKQFLTNFVSARVTAIRGYFDEIFTKKIHTEQLCVKKSDGTEICVNGDQMQDMVDGKSTTSTTINPIEDAGSTSSSTDSSTNIDETVSDSTEEIPPITETSDTTSDQSSNTVDESPVITPEESAPDTEPAAGEPAPEEPTPTPTP